jgi:hypothetical protein
MHRCTTDSVMVKNEILVGRNRSNGYEQPRLSQLMEYCPGSRSTFCNLSRIYLEMWAGTRRVVFWMAHVSRRRERETSLKKYLDQEVSQCLEKYLSLQPDPPQARANRRRERDFFIANQVVRILFMTEVMQ